MPVVTNARTGWLEGTGVPAREKLRTPAAVVAMPIRIRPPPAVQQINLTSGKVSGKGSRRSRANPRTRQARKRNGGRAMCPATAVSRACWLAGLMSAPRTCQAMCQRPGSLLLLDDNLGVILVVDNMGVNLGTGWRRCDRGDRQ